MTQKKSITLPSITFKSLIPMEYACHIFSKYLLFQVKKNINQNLFQKPISVKIPSILIKNLGCRLKYQVCEIKNFEILDFAHLKFENVRNPEFLVGFMYVLQFRLSQLLRKRRISRKYHTPAQLHQQQKHLTLFLDSFTNPTRESGEVKHYVDISGFHR